jgi:hypothetical protein
VINPIDAVQLARITPLDEAARSFCSAFSEPSTYATSGLTSCAKRANPPSANVVTRLVQSELDTLKPS